jgi:hypothetical protein
MFIDRSIVTMFDYGSGTLITHKESDDHNEEVCDVVAATKLRIFATATRRGVVKFWDEQNILV